MINKFWVLKKLGPRLFSATATKENKLCYPEHRVYFSKESIEFDFGEIDFKKIPYNKTLNPTQTQAPLP